MTDHEKEILDKIKQSTEKTPVPESLAPDQIMKMLEEHNSTQASGHIPKKHGFSRGHRMRGGLIAASNVTVSPTHLVDDFFSIKIAGAIIACKSTHKLHILSELIHIKNIIVT